MWKILAKINQNLVIAIPAVMALGFGYGLLYDASPLKSFIVPATFLMVYPMMVNLKLKKVLELTDLKTQLYAQTINFAIIPFLAFGLGLVFFSGRPQFALGLLLAGLVPTSGMTISWTGMARGNLAAAVKMTVIGLVLGSVATPFYVQSLLGSQMPLNLLITMQQIGLVVFLPMAVGFATRQLLLKRFGQEKFQQSISKRFPPFSTLGVLAIIFVAMALKARGLMADPAILLDIFAPLSLLYAANYAISTVLGKALLPRGDAIALVYGTVMRNLSIALALAMSVFGQAGADAALVIATAFILQTQSAAWYVRFTERIFGESPAMQPVKVLG